MLMKIKTLFLDVLRSTFLELTCIIILSHGFNIDLEPGEPVVHTKTGIIVGKYMRSLNNEVAAFLGIPYAKPPLNEKRFSKAEPVEPWRGELFATEKPPACMQFANRTEITWVPSPNLRRSEDCLYINVWVPTNYSCKAPHKLPVMVWLYGGGFTAGSINMDLHDGSVLASIGQIIVATVNYRVGLFGFLSDNSNEAPGNVGFYDPLLALEWIKVNIKYFGGSSKKITLFGGISACKIISSYLLLPEAQSKFSKAIMESGSLYSSFMFGTREMSLSKTDRYAKFVGCSNEGINVYNNRIEVMNCLRKKDARELAEAENSFTWKNIPFFGPSLRFEDPLTRNIFKNIVSNSSIEKNVLIGSNQNEGTIILSYFFPDLFPLNTEPTITLNEAKSIIMNIFETSPNVTSTNVINFYFSDIEEGDFEAILRAVSDAYGDFAINCPTLIFAERARKAHFYWMSYRSIMDKLPKWIGTTHADDVQYVFGRPFVDTSEYTLEDQRFSYDMIEKWTSFARYGHPLIKEKKKLWPHFYPQEPQVFHLNLVNEAMMPHPRKEACDLWRPYFQEIIKS